MSSSSRRVALPARARAPGRGFELACEAKLAADATLLYAILVESVGATLVVDEIYRRSSIA